MVPTPHALLDYRILDFRLERDLKKTQHWVQLAYPQSKIQNPKSKIGMVAVVADS